MTSKTPAPELPVVIFGSEDEWARWLDERHASERGVWMRFAKKGATFRTPSYAEALGVALCYGWIDSQVKKYDDESYIQKFTPRGPRSIWSKVNRDKALALIEAKRMRPAGHAAIETAKKNGRWDAAYDSQSKATVPDDLQRALDASPKAKKFFATLNSVNRYAIIFRLHNTKTEATRARKLAGYIEMLERGEKLH